jgi:chromosome segregation ATPase
MKNFRQSLLTLTLLTTAIMTTSFKVQDGVLFLTSKELKTKAINYRSIATLKEQQEQPIIVQLNIRIKVVIEVRNIISADKVLLEKLLTRSVELKEQIAMNNTDQNMIQDLKVKIVDLEKEISTVSEKLQSNISILEDEKTALLQNLESTQLSNDELQEQIHSLNEEFESQANLTQDEIDNANLLIEGLNNDLKLYKGELVTKEEAFQKLEQESCLKEKKISELQNEISVAIQDKEDVLTALAELEQELEKIEDGDSDSDSDNSDDSLSISDATTQTEIQTLVTAFSGVMTSQMQFIQQMQTQNQQFMMSQMLSNMGPVDTGTSSLERYLMYSQRGGINNFGFGGYSMPMRMDLDPNYSSFLTNPQYSTYPDYPMTPQFNQGIPSNIGFGGGRAPAVMNNAPIYRQGPPTFLN